MNDRDIRKTLEEGLSGPPSEGFNERVLAAIPERVVLSKRRFSLPDEPLLIGLGLLGGIVLCVGLGWSVFGWGGSGGGVVGRGGGIFGSGVDGVSGGGGELVSLLPLVLLPLVLLPIFIVLFNSVTGKAFSRQ